MPRHRRRTERLVAAIDCTTSGVPDWHRTRLTNAATVGTNLIVKNIKRLGFGSGTSRTIDSGSS